jgi:hypothetical protein
MPSKSLTKNQNNNRNQNRRKKVKAKKPIKIMCIGGDEPFAVVAHGHVPFKDFLRAANNGWSGEPFDEYKTRYEYCLVNKKGVSTNVSPSVKGVVPMTVGYWEEPIWSQKQSKTKPSR